MLTTTTLVKSHLGITGSTYDTLIGTIVSALDKFIENYTGVKVGNTDVVTITNEIRDHDGSMVLRTKFKPITSLTKIEYKDAGDDWAEYTEEAIADVDFDSEGDEIFPEYFIVGSGRRTLRLSYKCGYISSGGTANVPADLSQAATLMAAAIFARRGNEGVSSSSLQGLSQSFEDYTANDPFIRKILTQYKSVYAV